MRSIRSIRKPDSKSFDWPSMEWRPQDRLVVALRSLTDPLGAGERRVRVSFMERVLLDEPCTVGPLDRLKGHMLFDPTDAALMSRMADYPLIVSTRPLPETASSGNERPAMEGEAVRYAHFGLRDDEAERELRRINYCCVDVAPLLMGDHEKLVLASRLEPAAARGPLEAISWCNLPLVRCELTLERVSPLVRAADTAPDNLLRLTVRAAARLWDREPDDEHTLTTILPADFEEEVENVTFGEPRFGSAWNVNDDLKWETHKLALGHSLYMKNDWPSDIYNPHGINYEEYLETNERNAADCATWNTLRRRALYARGVSTLTALVARRRPWPIVLRTSAHRAIAFLDFTNLLLPGYKRVAVVAPLMECDDEATDSLEEADLRPLLDDAGEPAFLIVELELLRPLKPALPHGGESIETSELKELMRNIAGLRGEADGERKRREHVSGASERAFARLVRCARLVVEDEYRHYLAHTEDAPHTFHNETLLSKFVRFLYQSRAFVALRSSLTECAAEMTHGSDGSEAGEEEASVLAHVTLSRAAQAALGARPAARASLRDARFAVAQGDHRTADAIFMEHLSKNPYDEKAWFQYALYQVERGEVERAMCCLQEALIVNPRNKFAILLLATLTTRGAPHARDADALLDTLLRLHPTWRVAWVALFCHYKRTDRFDAADLALQTANSIRHQLISEEPVAVRDILFYTENIPPGRIFLQTAALFLHLRDYEFAELCLAEELELFGSGLHYEYLAIGCCLLRNHVAAAFSRVTRALRQFGHTSRLLLLESECVVRVGHATRLSAGGDARAPALLRLRRAFTLRHASAQPARALALARALAASEHSSLQAWLELSKHFTDMGQLEEAELCLARALSRAPQAPEPWAALSELHARRARYGQSALCSRRAQLLGHYQESVPEGMVIKNERPLLEPEDCSPHACRCDVESLDDFLASISPVQ